MKLFRKILKSLLLVIAGLVFIFFTLWAIRKFRVVKEITQINTSHFQINYKGILKTEAEDISKSLEENYNRIRTELNDPEHNTISVFIHSTQNDFNSATGLKNSTANGASRGPKAFHLMYQTWFNSVFPDDMTKVAVHEFTHCVQLNILIQDALSKSKKSDNAAFDKNFEQQFSEKYPQWFWEALCDYEAGIINKMSVKHGMKGKPTLKFLNTSNQIYNTGYTIIEYIVTKWGKEKLPDLIRTYCDLKKVLQITESEFEQGWHKFVQEKY